MHLRAAPDAADMWSRRQATRNVPSPFFALPTLGCRRIGGWTIHRPDDFQPMNLHDSITYFTQYRTMKPSQLKASNSIAFGPRKMRPSTPRVRVCSSHTSLSFGRCERLLTNTNKEPSFCMKDSRPASSLVKAIAGVQKGRVCANAGTRRSISNLMHACGLRPVQL